jgi:2-amino-4-hydroxy-6-hydroxymethyldihydropteridine diphosphokinase
MSPQQSARTVAAFIGIGSNLDEPVSKVRSALVELERLPATRVVRCSSLYRTAPVGYLEQPDFINAVARVDTTLDPHQLLAALLEIEKRHSRVRSVPNAPRTLDLDILLYGDRTIAERGLSVPHPRMHERAFVLIPLAEIAPEILIPGRGSAAALLAGVAADGVSLIGPA